MIWGKQKEIWDSVQNRKRTLVVSGHSTGKDYITGRIVPWFVQCFVPSIVITTAPTDRQVAKIIWGEIRAAVHSSKFPLGGRLLNQEWLFNERHYAIGFTTRDYATQSQKFQGFHQENVLIVLSEAAGIHQNIWDAVEGVSTGKHVRFLATTQPTGDAGPFMDAYRNGCHNKDLKCPCPKWHIIHISSWEAAEANERLNIPALAAKEWCQERRDNWGEEGPLYQVRVLGLIPKVSTDAIISLAWAVQATELELSIEGTAAVGVDVAWKGDDDSVITVARGQRQTRKEIIHGQDTIEVANRTLQVLREEKLKNVAVDVGGVGAGVYDNLMAASEEMGLTVIGVNFGGSPEDKILYVDKGSEMWWLLREDLRNGLFQLLPGNDQIAQLTNRKYKTPKGRIKIEPKPDMKKRGVKSPDEADSLVLAREAQRNVGASLLTSTSPEEETQSEKDPAVWREVG